MYLQIQKKRELYSPMKSQIFIYILALTSLLAACQESPSQEEILGVWVGTYQGKKAKTPFPAIFQFLPDSTYEMSFGLSTEKETGNWKLRGNLLQLGDSSWHAYFRKGGKLNLKRSRKSGPTYLMLRRPEKNSKLISLDESQRVLSKIAWTNIREIPQNGFCRQDVHTYQDEKLWIHRRYFYNQDTLGFEEIESFCYKLEEAAQQQFILFANSDSCTNHLAPRQILQINEEQLALLSFFHDENRTSKAEILPHLFYISLLDSSYARFSPKDRLAVFTPCEDEKGGRRNRYQDLTDDHDSLAVYIQRNFQNFPNSQSGRIELYLTVGCQGNVGRVNLIQTNQKGQPIYFAAPIVKQFFEMAVGYPYRANSEAGVDGQLKLVFEIEDGALVGVN